MVNQSTVRRYASLAPAFSVVIVSMGIFPSSQAVAQMNAAKSPEWGISSFFTAQLSSPTAVPNATPVTFIPPQGDAPQQTRGGASRGAMCMQQVTESNDVSPSLVLLIPSDSGYGLTTADRPTFFAYVPETAAPQLFFSLKDEAGQLKYQAIVPITGGEGVISLTLPETASPLEVGQTYQWGIALMCAGRLRPDSPFANGWVRRIELSDPLASQLNAADPLDRAVLYGDNGLWYDVLATLAQLRQEQPDNTTFMSNWQGLLDAVGLQSIAPAPLID